MGVGWTALLVLQLGATAAMTGLIWFVQVVHYPLYRAVGVEGFAAYEAAHTRLTSFVVGPLMGVETAAAVLIAVLSVPGLGWALPLAGLLALLLIHVATAAFSVPAHRVLTDGYDAAVASRLVRTNWMRTGLWTARLVLAAWMLLAVQARLHP
jgi:hypothetical protein